MVLDTALLIKECRYENHIGQRIYTLINGRIYKCIYSNYKNVKNLLLLLCGSIYKEQMAKANATIETQRKEHQEQLDKQLKIINNLSGRFQVMLSENQIPVNLTRQELEQLLREGTVPDNKLLYKAA